MPWLAAIGRTLNVTNTRIGHPWEGEQPGMDSRGFHLRHSRVGTHPSGTGPRGHPRLGFNTLITPAQVHVKAHLAALGPSMGRGRAWPHAALIRQLNPTIRGGAHDDRTWV